MKLKICFFELVQEVIVTNCYDISKSSKVLKKNADIDITKGIKEMENDN